MKFLVFASCLALAAASVPIVTVDNAVQREGWIVQVDCESPTVASAVKSRLVARENVRTWKIGTEFCAIGGALNMSDVEFFADLEGVEYIQHNLEVQINGEQTNPPSWGLDRIDQADLPLNNLYRYNDGANGEGVNVYVLDTGIKLDHNDWNKDQANFGIDCSDLFGLCFGRSKGDKHGHGTHCAGTIASPSYGVAKGASVWDVKVLKPNGAGGLFGIMSGVEFVTEHDTPNAKILSMSLGAPKNIILNRAINAAYKAGVTCVAAAGNEDAPTCGVSPASASGVIAVGASDIEDQRAYFSNHGSCTDLFAPGHEITSLGVASDDDEQTYSGTSMACPHVAGAAAAIASRGITDPDQIKSILISEATDGKLTDIKSGSPNKLLFTSPN